MDRLSFDGPPMDAAFVLSAPRSGSTLLRYLLDTHSRIASPGEIFLARLCFDLDIVMSRTIGIGLPPGRAGEERLGDEIRRLAGGIMEAYARSKGKDVWCDKSPRNVEYLPSLVKTFPRARYICLYRNCLDTVKSMLSASQQGFMIELAPYAAKSPGNLVAAMIDAWCDYTAKILDFEAAHPAATFRIRYEDVVLEPERTLRPLFEFLEVGWEPQVVERALSTPHDEGGGDLFIKYTKTIDRSSIGKGSTIPYPRIQPALAAMNALLERLDYATVGADWNDRPSPYLPPEPVATKGPAPAAESAAASSAEPVSQPAPAHGAAEAAAGRPGDLADFFLRRLPAELVLRTAEVARANASVRFVIEDGEAAGLAAPAVFWVDLRREPRVLAEDRPADCTLTMPREVLFAIAGRELNPVAAFGQSKIRVQGPLTLAAHMMRFV